MMVATLPNPTTLIWSHATNSLEKLHVALNDPLITAIEGDILMGWKNDATTTAAVPIMSHPPHLTSDLTTTQFLHLITATKPPTQTIQQGSSKQLNYHLKLDFKDIEALSPTLDEIYEMGMTSSDYVVYLNADIVAGPGIRDQDVIVPADRFLEICQEKMEQHKVNQIQTVHKNGKKLAFAFSLGFKVDVVHLFGYNRKQLDHMTSLINQYNLMQRSAGVVLAVNARLLAKSLGCFDTFLQQFPTAQLLAWTGATEPPISQWKLNYIAKHFHRQGTVGRVGFDCQIAPSNLHGTIFDLAILVVGVWKLATHLFRHL